MGLLKVGRSTVQVTGSAGFDSKSYLRGLHSGRVRSSLAAVVDKQCRLYISTIARSYSQGNMEQELRSKHAALTGLLSGCTYTEVEGIPIRTRHFSALLELVGVPASGTDAPLTALVNGLIHNGVPATIIVNFEPVWASYTPEAESDFIVSPSKVPIENQLLKPGLKRTVRTLEDASFLTTFAVFINRNDSYDLKANIETVRTLLGSIYSASGSKVGILLREGRKALQMLERLLQGELLHASVLTAQELSSYFQVPQTYGIEALKPIDFGVPTRLDRGINIGRVLGSRGRQLDRVRFDPDTIFEHLVVWGGSGTGKSTFLKNLMVKLHNEHGMRCLVFDFHDEYREILHLLNGDKGRDVLVVNPFLTGFSLNPLELPRVVATERDIAVVERTENFISLVKQLFILGQIQEAKVREALYSIYGNGDRPVIQDLVSSLEGKRLDSLTSKLRKFTLGFYGDIFNQAHSTLRFNQIERATTVFELAKLPKDLRIFLVSVFLILWWDYRRIKRPQEASPHVLILDEFHHYQGLSVVQKLLSEARKFRQGLVCSCQGPNQISDSDLLGDLVRNTVAKVVFRQDLSADQRVASVALGGLKKDQEDYLSLMETGEAVVKLKHVKHPFRMMTYRLQELDQIPNRQILEWFGDGNQLPIRPEDTPEQQGEADLGNVGAPRPPPPSFPMADLEERFLRAVHARPGIKTPEVGETIGVGKGRAYKLKNSLVEKGLLSEENVRGGVGRPHKILKLSETALTSLDMERENRPANHGGEEHYQKVREIANMLEEAGWYVQVEEGHTDIRAQKGDRKVAIEVETGKHKDFDQVRKNIEKNLVWADEVVLVVSSRETAREIPPDIRSKAKILTYEDLRFFSADK